MSSLRPSYCKKSSNGITSACGTPTERSVIQNSCPLESDSSRSPSSCLIPKRLLSRNIPSRNTDAVTSPCHGCFGHADLVLQCLNILQSHLLTCLSLSDCKIVDSRIYSAVRSAYSVRCRPGDCCCYEHTVANETPNSTHKITLIKLYRGISWRTFAGHVAPLSKEKNCKKKKVFGPFNKKEKKVL